MIPIARAVRRSHELRACSVLLCLALTTGARAESTYLSVRNSEAPFCYLAGGERSWPFLERELPPGARFRFVARRDGETLAAGAELAFSGLSVGVGSDQKLSIAAEASRSVSSFTLEVSLTLPDGGVERQELSVRAAPPVRPISYVADFGDDLIRIFMDSRDGRWRPITKSGFDQYFRRCQAHGVTRLIVWLSPFPYACDPKSYSTEEWGRYAAQAEAIVESDLLEDLIARRKRGAAAGEWGLHVPWGWIRQLCAIRLQRDFGAMLAASAREHGIRLTASFRPFETALTKYYEIPAFDHDGKFLWGFLPLATPPVNYRPEETCFAHYRTILREMNKLRAGVEAKGRLGTIECVGVVDAARFVARFRERRDNLRIVAVRHAPLNEDSFVLERQRTGDFRLRPFRELRAQVQAQQRVLSGYDIEHDEGRVRITGLKVPFDARFLILSNPSAADDALELRALEPIRLWSQAGNRLGRENVFWALDASLDPDGRTRVAGIPLDGGTHTEFYATEACYALLRSGPEHLPLRGHELVIDLGAPWSVEMMDLNRPAMRANAVKELATLLSLGAFDELFINTRSHVQLAAYQADGAQGIQPLHQYRIRRERYAHLGIDRAYAPLAAADDPVLRELAADRERVENVTTWQRGEWDERCQSDASPFRWRYVRNREVARGVRSFLEDLKAAFPGVRTRVVLPMREEAARAVQDGLETMKRSDGTPYGRNYGGVWSTINHIRSIGEGMAMVDLHGLAAEPVLFGVRGLPDAEPFALYLQHSLADLRDNRGSSFRGPRSFFHEAQATLRAQDRQAVRRRREELICSVLAHEREVGEVILYEAADWLYFLPLADPEVCGHAFVERCRETH